MTDVKAVQEQDAALVADSETSALSRWEAVAIDIANATKESEGRIFNYRDKKGEKAARSWIAQLRKIKASVERARKEAKSVHLERGKRVDETAKLLTAAVQGLIEPHETEIKAIEAEEQARIDAHKAVLARIESLTEGIETSQEASLRLAALEEIDVSGLEEFSTAGQNRKAEAIAKLQELGESLLLREIERAELELLRAAAAKREEEERANSARLAGITEGLEMAERARSSANAARPAAPSVANKRLAFINQLCLAMQGKSPADVASAIADGALHQALTVDWRKVNSESEDSIPW